jgi:hypothetical protein
MLVTRGRAQVGDYDWGRCVDGLVDLYGRAVDRS